VICVAGLPAHLHVKAQDFLAPQERAQGFRFSREIWFTASSFFFQLSGLLGFHHRVQRPCAPGLGFVLKMVCLPPLELVIRFSLLSSLLGSRSSTAGVFGFP
jgi:hypothetical protein